MPPSQKEELARLMARVDELEKSQKALLAENKEMKSRIDKLEKANERQSEAHKRAEIEKTKKSVIIKGVPLHKEVKAGDAEDKKQTNEVVQNFLKSLNLGGELGFPDAIRFKPSEKSKGKGPEFIKLTVSTVKHKAKLYEALAKAKDKKKKVPKISVTDEIPNFLKDKHAKLDEAAYNLRKKVKGIKTRIFFKGTTIVLKAKKENETAFSEINNDGEPVKQKESQSARNQAGAAGKS